MSFLNLHHDSDPYSTLTLILALYCLILTLGFSANYDADYANDKLRFLKFVWGKGSELLGGTFIGVKGSGFNIISILEIAVLMSTLTGLILNFLWSIIRRNYIKEFVFSGLAFTALLVGSCVFDSRDYREGGYENLGVSMQSYVPSCFLSFSLGERRTVLKLGTGLGLVSDLLSLKQQFQVLTG